VDGTALERLTFSPGFDGFPLFSPNGSRLAFSSNRNQQKEGDTNVFVARFVDGKREAVVETGADRVARDIAWLSDDAREGRGLGSAGLAAATDWLEKRFGQIGLEPLGGSH